VFRDETKICVAERCKRNEATDFNKWGIINSMYVFELLLLLFNVALGHGWCSAEARGRAAPLTLPTSLLRPSSASAALIATSSPLTHLLNCTLIDLFFFDLICSF
jgi:hypothetical protein